MNIQKFLTTKEVLALKAVLYLAERNRRVSCGGTYVEDIKHLDTCGRISFAEALDVVATLLYSDETTIAEESPVFNLIQVALENLGYASPNVRIVQIAEDRFSVELNDEYFGIFDIKRNTFVD